jgi:hypothetical protein
MYIDKGSIRKVGSAEGECALNLQKRLRRLRSDRLSRSWLFPDDEDCSEDIELRAERLCKVAVDED